MNKSVIFEDGLIWAAPNLIEISTWRRLIWQEIHFDMTKVKGPSLLDFEGLLKHQLLKSSLQ